MAAKTQQLNGPRIYWSYALHVNIAAAKARAKAALKEKNPKLTALERAFYEALKNNLELGGFGVVRFSPPNIMKSVSINLDDERAAKLKALSDSTRPHCTSSCSGQNFEVEQRKISASAIAIGLLNAAIDNAHNQLPQ